MTLATVAATLPPSQIVQRQLLNMHSALRTQGHDPIMADHVMRAELTRYLAERALESAEGPQAERTLALAAFDGHLALRGRVLTPEAEIRKFEHEAALAADERRADRDAMTFFHGFMVCVVVDLCLGGAAALIWALK